MSRVSSRKNFWRIGPAGAVTPIHSIDAEAIAQTQTARKQRELLAAQEHNPIDLNVELNWRRLEEKFIQFSSPFEEALQKREKFWKGILQAKKKMRKKETAKKNTFFPKNLTPLM